MLRRSVVVSDKSTCLTEQYEDRKELLLFDLTETDRLPARVKTLLDDDAAREEIAETAYRRAVAEDTWKQRAELFLFYLGELGYGKTD